MNKYIQKSQKLMMTWVGVLCLAWLVAPASSEARLKIKLQDGIKFKQYKIAVPAFKAMGGSQQMAKKITAILRNDLTLSGTFKVLDPSSYQEKAEKSGIEPKTFDFEPWVKISAEGLLKGSYTPKGSGYLVKFRFYELGSNKLAYKEDFTIPSKATLRWYLHLFADRLYKFLTKERGIFRTKIAYIRNYRGSQEVWMMDFDGGSPRKLTNNGSINALPAWSPNGRYIAYTSWKKRNPDLFIQDVRTGKSRKISPFKGLNTGAAWSPDSQRIAFSASRGKSSMDIYVVNVSGGTPVRLTKAKWGIRNLSPTWSPDGKKISFVSTRYGSPQIFVMDVNGNSASNIQQLVTKGKYNQSPKWSPKGDWILFTGRDERNVFDLFIVDPKTRKVKRLTQNQGNNTEAAWSPNGQNIVFSSTRDGVSKLFIMTKEGKYAKKLTYLSGKYLTPTWSPWLSK